MIGCFNVDPVLSDVLGNTYDLKKDNKDVSGILIDWIPTKKGSSHEKAATLLRQSTILEEYTKTKIPIVIFDRYRSITNTEYKWLKKFNIVFFEPSLLPREGFKYLPFWTHIKKLNDIPIDDHERKITLGYIGDVSDKIKSFEKYYVKAKQMNNDLVVAYHSKNVLAEKEREYTNLSVELDKFSYNTVQMSVMIGSQNDYKTGYLDPYFFKALEVNCIPFVPTEHRFYHAIGNVASDYWATFHERLYEHTYIGLILDIYENIDKYYPEMKVNHTVDTIKKVLGA